MEPSNSIITLLTDFGTENFFVGAMKGVILSINPSAVIVDITHDIPPQDLRSAAFTMAESCKTFPPGTIHVAVVDPGVGSERKPLLLSAGGHFYIGPDNGIFSFILAETVANFVIHMTNEDYFWKPVSATFHGRDIFSPTAAWLSTGVHPEKFGPEITAFQQFDLPHPKQMPDGTIQGEVIHVDRFGNLITNLTNREIPDGGGISIMINGRPVSRLLTHFAEASPGNPFAFFGSTGRLEIAVNKASAADVLRADIGTELVISPR